MLYRVTLTILTLSSLLQTCLAQRSDWDRALHSDIRQNFLEKRNNFTAMNVSSGQEAFVFRQKELYNDDEIKWLGGFWKSITDGWQQVTSGEQFLELRGTDTKVGDVVLLRNQNQKLPLIYLGEKTFRGESRSRSFFLYPGADKVGLEVNTMPPRWHSALMLKAGIATHETARDRKLWLTQRFETPGITVSWSRRKNVRKPLVSVKWWNRDTAYRVVRLKNSADYRLKYELKFERVAAASGARKWVLTKWTDGKRDTWGEKGAPGNQPDSYQEGEIIFKIEQPWDVLTDRLGKYGLPADPDPITTLDVALGILADPPTQEKYPSAHRIVKINRDSVQVEPVIYLPNDRIFFPDEKATTSNSARFKWLPLDVSQHQQRFTWKKDVLNERLNWAIKARQLNETQRYLELYLQGVKVVIDGTTSGARKAAGAALKTFVTKKVMSNVRKSRLRSLLLNAIKAADGPLGKATAASVMTLVKEVNRAQVVTEYYRTQGSSTQNATAVSGRLHKELVRRAGKKAGQVFLVTLATEAMKNASAKSAPVRGRVESLLQEDGVVTYIVQPLSDKFATVLIELLIDQSAVGGNLIGDALSKSETQAEFEQNLKLDLQQVLPNMLKAALKTAVEAGF